MRARLVQVLVVLLAAAGLAVAVPGAPAQAATPTLTVDRSTGDENSVFRGTGAGFAPGRVTITVSVDGAPYRGSYTRTRTADASGAFTWVWVWSQGDPFGTYTYTATDSAGTTTSVPFTITLDGRPPTPAAGTSLMFDARSAPSLATMQTWVGAGAPYRTVGVYVPVTAGSDNRSDKTQANLTAGWVQQVRDLGVEVLPIYVGAQAPATCQGTPTKFVTMSSVPAEAAQQGRVAAADAAASVTALGVSTSVPVVLDLEGYDDGCSAAVRAFVDAWTTGLHQAGRLSGVYGSQSSTMKDVSGLAAAGQAPPDAVWIATDNRRPETTRLTYPPDGTFVGRRLNQFHLDLDRTFGGVTIRVDESAVDDGVLTGTPPVPTPPAVPAVPAVPAAPAPPAVPTTARLAPVTLAKEVAASWSGPAASYDVRVRTGTWRRPLSAPSQPAALQGTTARTTSVRLRPGSTWCYAVRARSASGATSAWSAESCTTSPLDDRRLAARGWTRGTDRAAYLRTTTLTRSPGATLRLPRVRTARVGLVVAPGSRGAVRASIDGKRLGIVRTSGRRGQRVVWLRAGPVRSGTLVLTTVGRAPVRLAGVVLPASG